jgi:hypothetical protein
MAFGTLFALMMRMQMLGFLGAGEERKRIWAIVCVYDYPRIIDLDGDGWAEIVMADKDGRLKIWRFDRRERRLKVIATSPPLSAAFSLQLFDLDEDGRKEIAVTDVGRDCWVFQWRDGKLKMWKGKTTRSQSYKGLRKVLRPIGTLWRSTSPCLFLFASHLVGR